LIDPETRREVPAWLQSNAELAGRYRLEQAVERIYMPRQATAEVPAGALTELYDHAAAALGDVPLLYLEFGVAGGRSISRMTERFHHRDARFIGFDSFEGLPEDWVKPWETQPRGTYSMGGRMPAIADPRVSFVQGWFQNTFPVFLAANPLGGRRPILVHYDADLYSSTLFILTNLWHAAAEYFFIFDEFMGEELIALDDFTRAFPTELGFMCQTNAGNYPAQVFGQMRRLPFAPAE